VVGRGLVIALLVLAATATGAISRPAAASTSREDHLRADIAQLLNGERSNRGLPQLPVDGGLQQRAQAWTEHNRSTGCEPPTDCHSPDAEAEILAWGGQDSTTGAIVVAWMQSDVHRNILLHSQATAIGVGFACSDSGWVYATVQFTGIRKPVPQTPQDPIKSVAAQGTACTGGAAPLSQTAPPSTTSTSTPAPATAPPATSPPATAPRKAPVTTAPAAPVTVAPVVASPATAAAPLVTTTTTSTPPSIVLSASLPEVKTPSFDDEMALSVDNSSAPRRTEAAWIAMVVVVVFLSALRIGFQLRDNALAKEKVRARGL
jgi:hypothetical protein